MDFEVRDTELDTGLRVLEIGSSRVATAIGISFAAGTRHEFADEVGVAHLLEHVVFRGTRDHPTPRGLNRAAEALGTELEGVTGPDRVLLYATVRGDRAAAALDLLTQITSHALLRDVDIEHERQVVLQEISELLDDDASQATALIRQAVFGEHRVGRDVAGLPDDITSLKADKVASFHRRQWTSREGLVVIAGDLSHLERDRLMGQLSEIGTTGEPVGRLPITYDLGNALIETIEGDTVHLRLMYDIPGIDLTSTKHEATAAVVSSMLGGPMSSRLIEELREANPLCYWIDATIWGYETATFLSIRCSVAVENYKETLERITIIVASLRDSGPQPGEVAHFRAFISGSMGIDLDDSRTLMLDAVESVMEFPGRDIHPHAFLAALEAVTERDVTELCRRIGATPSIAYVGPTGPEPQTLKALLS